MKEFSTEQLRNELAERGYQTQNLWHVDDVMQNYECETEDAMEILKDSLNNGWVVEQVFGVIDHYATETYNLKIKE